MKIVISGMIGIGKSTTCLDLQEKLKIKDIESKLFEEDSISDSIFLKYYYNDSKQWAFLTQVYFLLNRYKNLISKDKGEVTIFDRHLVDDLVFANVISKQEMLTQEELDIYLTLNSKILDGLEEKIDYFILLKAPFETILKRIKGRAREVEAEVEESYWREVYDAYYEDAKIIEYFKSYSANFEIIEIGEEKTEDITQLILNSLRLT